MRHAYTLALIPLLFAGCISVRGNVHSEVNTVAAVGKLRHVVFIKFQPTATPADIAKVENGMQDLANEVDAVQAFEWGTEATGRGLNKDFTHAAIFTFENKEGLQAYLVHPAHINLVETMTPYIADLFVFDYIARD
jgi:hypothetical protein